MTKRLKKRLAASILTTLFVAAGCATETDQLLLDNRASEEEQAAIDASGQPNDFGFESDGFGECNELTLQFEKRIPTVMLVVDRSSSMFDNAYGSSPDRWQPLYEALVGSQSGVVSQLDGEIRFGLMTYTNDAHSQTCPSVSEVPPAMDNYASIKSAYDQASSKPSFKGETPTGPAINRAAQILQAMGGDGPKYIVLATDGEPDTCGTPDPQCGQDESITAVQEAYAAGIETIVLGIGDQVGAKHLGDMANAGAGRNVEQPSQSWIHSCYNTGLSGKNASYASSGDKTPYYKPADKLALASDLQGIIGGVRDCGFELNVRVNPKSAHLCEVELDGVPLEHGISWTLATETQIEIVGGSCDTLKQDSEQLYINCPCDVIAPR